MSVSKEFATFVIDNPNLLTSLLVESYDDNSSRNHCLDSNHLSWRRNACQTRQHGQISRLHRQPLLVDQWHPHPQHPTHGQQRLLPRRDDF